MTFDVLDCLLPLIDKVGSAPSHVEHYPICGLIESDIQSSYFHKDRLTLLRHSIVAVSHYAENLMQLISATAAFMIGSTDLLRREGVIAFKSTLCRHR